MSQPLANIAANSPMVLAWLEQSNPILTASRRLGIGERTAYTYVEAWREHRRGNRTHPDQEERYAGLPDSFRGLVIALNLKYRWGL